MKITLPYLKKAWDKARISKIKKAGEFWVGSEKMLDSPGTLHLLPRLDAVWSTNHDRAVKKRNDLRERCYAKHIFISQICDVAVEEYETVCRLLKINRIAFVSFEGDKKFFSLSEKAFKDSKVEIDFRAPKVVPCPLPGHRP